MTSQTGGVVLANGRGLKGKVRDMVRRVSPEDLLGTSQHSRDFRHSRAEYVSVRVRILAFLFAVLAPLWIPIDYFVMDGERFGPMVGLRLTFSVLLIGLGLWGTHCNRLRAARARMAGFLLVPALFYVGSRVVLGGGLPEDGVLAGYSFLPFLMVALLAVVPLTLLEGVAFIAIPAASLIGSEWYFGTLSSVHTLGQLWLLALLAMISLWIQMTQLHMLMRLYREATRDALTGLVNRRVLYRWLDQDIAARTQSGGTLSVLLFDLDLFKRVNDTYGHLAGDAVLQTFARVLQHHLPETAVIGRYGGEEFLAVLPGMDLEQARTEAERIRRACHENAVADPDSDAQLIRFTTSTGVAQWRPAETAEELLVRVDNGLYQAKESGRDLVAVAL